MKQILFTLFIISTLGLFSCRKDKFQQTIKQYDSTQIVTYMAAHNLTGFVKDTAGGDTSGMWYKIISPGTGPALQYSDLIPMVYTLQTFDGTFVSSDTVVNHYYDYLGHVQVNGLPLGLQTALYNDLKHFGGSMRVLIPSRLAYGRAGSGSGSSKITNNRIAGNECLDYYVNVINDISKYDDKVIQNYMRDSSLVGYNKVESILDTPNTYQDTLNNTLHHQNFYYYKLLTAGSGTDYLTDNSTATVIYDGLLLNGTNFNSFHTTGGTPFLIGSLTQGDKEALEKVALLNSKIDIIVPSTLGYGWAAQSGIPKFSCLRFTFVIDAVSP